MVNTPKGTFRRNRRSLCPLGQGKTCNTSSPERSSVVDSQVDSETNSSVNVPSSPVNMPVQNAHSEIGHPNTSTGVTVNTQTVKTRSGRVVKPVNKLDL